MTKMIVDIPTKYDKMIGHLKTEKDFGSKSMVAAKIIEDWFKRGLELE